MPENKDYTKLTLEELLVKEKKIKNKKIISAVIFGFLVGVLIYGVAKNGIGFLHIIIPLVLIAGVYESSQKDEKELVRIQAEINDKR